MHTILHHDLKMNGDSNAKNGEDFWIRYIYKAYFKEQGIDYRYPATWNAQTEAAIKARNPHLADQTFVKPRVERPYLILNTAMMGHALNDVTAELQMKGGVDFINYEIGGYAAGTPLSMDNQEGVHVGGYIESFAMSGFRKNSSQTVPGGSTEPSVLEYTQLGVAARTSNLVWGAATGGTAYGVKASKLFNNSNWLIPQLFYDSPETTEVANFQNRFAVMDSGNVENLGVMSLLARRVKRILVLSSTGSKLSRAVSDHGWFGGNAHGPKPCDLFSIFGLTTLEGEQKGDDCELYRRNQVFDKADFDPVMDALNRSQVNGNIPIHLTTLTTVENQVYGVPAGHQVQVLFMVLGKATKFEEQLPDNTRQKMSDKFPHMPTAVSMDQEHVNLLAAQMQWAVESNKDVFDRFFADQNSGQKVKERK